MFSGLVQEGAGRGRALGFPTANIAAPSDCEDGVYVVRVLVGGSDLPALCFIGVAEMFGESERRAEVYILDWTGNLYGKEIQVLLLKKIRESRRFDSAEDLIRAMKEDLRAAEEYFERNEIGSLKGDPIS